MFICFGVQCSKDIQKEWDRKYFKSEVQTGPLVSQQKLTTSLRIV